ncbi:MAG TPA: hypothetical protein VG757_15235 [Devosia sp.]|nr:hypothetical protein [Devosia sp.]
MGTGAMSISTDVREASIRTVGSTEGSLRAAGAFAGYPSRLRLSRLASQTAFQPGRRMMSAFADPRPDEKYCSDVTKSGRMVLYRLLFSLFSTTCLLFCANFGR